MPLAEAGHAFRVRVAQRLGGLAGRIVHGHAFPGHGAAHAVQVRRGTPTSPSRRPCRPRTARPSRLRRCLPGLRRRPPKRCRRSGLRPMSSWRRAGPASFAFRYCSWNPMFRLLSEIHLQMFTPLPVGSDRRTNPVRTLHMPGRRQTSISDSFPSSTCYATTVLGVSGWTFSRKAADTKKGPRRVP